MKKKRHKKGRPHTLEQAHAVLEAQLSPEVLAEIDQMKSEDEMYTFHADVGRWMRNDWGLWGGSALADVLRGLGFTHPDDMSSVILTTLWCKRHDEPFRLEERAEAYRLYWLAEQAPPEDLRDPRDGAEIKWNRTFKLVMEGPSNHAIHAGQNRVTGQWVAYTYTLGAYVPEAALLERIKRAANR